MEMFMTDQSSGSPKRVTRRRTKKTVADESGEPRETGLAEAQAPKPVIEDVFDEIGGMRRGPAGYPTEQDMDFDTLDDTPPPPRRARTRRPEPAPAEGTDESQPAAAEPPRRGRAARPAPAPETSESDSAESSHRAPPASESAPSTSAPADSSGGGHVDFIADALGDAASGPQDYPTGPEGFQDGGQNRRRRRRRGRGRGPNGGPENAGGYGGPSQQRPPQGRFNNNQQGYGQQNQARGRGRGQDNRRPQYNGNANGRTHSEPRPNQDRGPDRGGPETVTPVQGILELHPKGYGFLRDAKAGYISQDTDPFVSGSLLEKYGIREGVLITGESIPGGRGQGPRLRSIQSIEGRMPEQYVEIKNFDSLTPINPNVQIKLETGATPVTMRVMDLLTPIGKGQRALIVAPPRTGKTMLLQEIADSVSTNYPEIYLIVLLIDERPEEVTEMRRRVKGEVVASSLDREVENHIRVSQLVFERAKRMAESGRDVFVLLDSITRTARAFNKWTNTGRTGTGGLDVKAMDIPKKMFGMARQFDEGGSLTVVGTALIETGSRMDEAIFLEFKGTGNMEMVLSRDLSERRIWPAIDISKSGTRREEKILTPDVLEGVTLLRRSLVSLSPVEAMEQLTRILQKYPTNADFLAKVRSIL